jgi:hypothetical protein
MCGVHGKVYVWAYVNQALLCINMAENGNCSRTFGGSLAYLISTKSVKDVWDTWKSLCMGLCKPGFIVY